MPGRLRLLIAVPLALAVSSMAMVVELIMSQGSFRNLIQPGSWDGGFTFALLLAVYIVPFGLIPGLLLHALFVRLRWGAFWQYLLAALLLGAAWCGVFHVWIDVGGAVMAGILAAALFGTSTFWLLRRPDRTFPHIAAN